MPERFWAPLPGRSIGPTMEPGSHLCGWGYVSWLPPEAAALPELRVRIDEWVLPSHTQAARVSEGSLDLAIAWIEEADNRAAQLEPPHLLWYEKLEAVMPRAHPATRHERCPPPRSAVLVER